MSTRSWRFATNKLQRRALGALLVALVSGALWFAAVVAVLLFRALPDPASAGQLAADIFMATYVVGGIASLLGLIFSKAERSICLALLVVEALLIFWIVPALRAHGAGWPGSFATLHGSASLGHLALCLGTLFWAWRLMQPGPLRG